MTFSKKTTLIGILAYGMMMSTVQAAPSVTDTNQSDPTFFQDTDSSNAIKQSLPKTLPQSTGNITNKSSVVAVPVKAVPSSNVAAPANGNKIPAISLPQLPSASIPANLPPAGKVMPASIPPANTSAAPIKEGVQQPSSSIVQTLAKKLPGAMLSTDEDKEKADQKAKQAAATDIQQPPSEEDNTSSPWKGSLMFDDSTMRILNNALHRTAGQPQAQDQGGDNSNNDGQPVANMRPAINYPRTSPSFYINSIIYFSPTNWSIWLNNHVISYPITEVPGYPSLTVINVNAKQVTLEWEPDYIDYISPNWRKALIDQGGGIYTNAKNTIHFDEDIETLRFVLRPNQTFSVYDMGIAEGYFTAAKLTPPAPPPAPMVKKDKTLSDQLADKFDEVIK